MKKILLLILFFPAVIGAQTYHNSASNPADNGTLSGTTITCTPPASMQAGDLVILIGQIRSSSSDITMSADGGQNWQRVDLTIAATNISARVYWCRYNGAWDADPSMAFLAVTGNTVVMHVFRPSTSTNTWALDQAGATAAYALPTNPFDVTRAGQTTVNDKAVTMVFFFSPDDNTWTEQTGGYTAAGSAQYRNLSGSDQSMVGAYSISATAGTATGDATWRQATNGGDAGAHAVITWYEYTPTKVGVPWAIFNY